MNTDTSPVTESRAVKEFIKLVRSRLKEKGWSVVRLSKECGVSRVYLQNVLAGKHDPGMQVAEKIAEHLGLRIRTEARQKKLQKSA